VSDPEFEYNGRSIHDRAYDAEVRLEDACDEIITLKAALEGAKATADDLTMQVRFWRQCAEQALEKWNTLEDEHELLVDTLRAIVAKESADAQD
jgi:hypothetical protein